jgi:hypothetical protein
VLVFVDDCAVSPPVEREVRLWRRSVSTRGCVCGADAVSGGIDWPGLVTSDGGVSVPTIVDDSSPLFRVA